MKKVYVASSWRNQYQPMVVKRLRKAGIDVYDFRNPSSGGNGFKWSDISPYYTDWTFEQKQEAMNHPLAQKQFQNDVIAMNECRACVLVLPCGKSAHMEAGWFAGRGKPVYVLMPEKQEPELMYLLFNGVFDTVDSLIQALG